MKVRVHMSYSLTSFKGVTYGIIQGSSLGVIKGDIGSLGFGAHGSP